MQLYSNYSPLQTDLIRTQEEKEYFYLLYFSGILYICTPFKIPLLI